MSVVDSFESEERFRDLVELSSDWYWEQDENFRFVDTEKSPDGDSSLRGAADYVGKTRWELYADSLTPEQWAAHRRQLEAHEEFRNLEFERRGRDGRMRWVSVSGRPFYDAQGRFRGYRGIGKDITERKLAELALRESEERFRRLAALAADWYWEQDAEYRFTRIEGPDATPLEGFKQNIGKRRWEQAGVELTPEQWAEHRRTVEAHLPFHDLELPIRDAEGKRRWMSVNGEPSYDVAGRFTGYRGTAKEITARKAAEQALRESEERFRSLVELSTDFYWEQDEELRFVARIGMPWEKLTGSGEEAVGKRRWELPALNMAEADWARHRADLEARREFRNLEIERPLASGGSRWISTSGRPIFDAEGRFRGYRGIGQDITARKLAEQALLASEERFRAAFEQAAVGMALRGLDGRWLDVNQKLCEILGYTRAELLGLTSVDITPAEDRAEAVAYNERMRRGELATYSREKQYLRRDGTPVWVMLTVSAVNGPGGKPDRLITVVEDISERKRAERALRRSEQRFRGLIELSSDWYWEQDENFRFRHLAGPGASALARGGDPSIYVGKARWETPDLAPAEGGWSAHRAQLERHEPFRDLVLRRQMDDGTLRYMAISGEPIFDGEGRFAGYRGVGRDVTAQRRAEQLRGLELAVSRLIAENPSAADALKAALHAICESEQWDCGRYLWVDGAANVLRFGEGWNVADPNIERWMDDSRRHVYAPGFGIAGTVWQSQQPLWVPDITQDPRPARPALARATGMRATFAVPVAAEGKTIGVLIFQSHQIREPDEQLLRTLRLVGGQIGLFMQRSQAETELRRFRLAMDSSADMILLVDRATMRFVDVNRTVCRLLGYTREELLAMDPEDLLPVSRAELEAAYDRQIADPSLPGGMRSYYRCKDGSQLPFESRRQVLRAGDRWLISVVARDIRERIEAERALREREAQLRLVTDNLPAMVCYLDQDCRYRYANLRYREFCAGSAEPIEGKALAEVLGEAAWQAVRPSIERALAGEPVDYTRKHRRASDGSRRELDVSLVPHRDPAGRVLGVYVMVLDVTRRRRAEAALHLRNRAIEQSVNAIVITQSVEGRQKIVYVNPAFERVTGYASAEVVGKNPAFLHRHDRNQAGVQALRAAEREQREMTVLVRNFRKDDTPFWNELRVAPVRDEDGRVTHYIGVSNDVTDRIRYQEEIERNANYDTLTGLPNRNLLNDRIARAILQAGRSGHALAVAFVDLDHLKRINDSLGHEMGDKVIAAIGRRVAETLRTGDTVARVSGDEFVIVLPDLLRADDAAHVAGKVLNCVGTPLRLDAHEFVLSASMGIALHPKDGTDAATLLRNADAALYRAKEQGRGCFRFFAPEMNQRAVEFLALERDLRRALDEREFRLQYQPIVNIASGEAVGAEALIRWHRADGSVVAPGHFIPVAEESGLIVPIGRWVLEAAARQAGRWNRGRRAPFYVSINLSARQFRDPGLVGAVRDAVKVAALDPAMIKLEITESTVMQNAEDAARMLAALKALGVKLSVDDFGTGYSSLGYLKRFPIDTLKIDRTFVRDLAVDKEDLAICDAVIGLGHGLELEVVAEGVETREQAEVLAAHGCRLAQGYLFGRPVDPENFPTPARAVRAPGARKRRARTSKV